MDYQTPKIKYNVDLRSIKTYEMLPFHASFLRSEMEVSMAEFKFASKEHENFFYSMLKKCGNHDSYHRAFFYCVGISDTTRANVGRLFDFEQHHIKPEGLHEGAGRSLCAAHTPCL